MRLLPLAALCLLLLLSRYAWADDIGPDQAQALQQQLKDWLAGLLGPAVKQPELGLRVTGEHDHYVVTWPIPGVAARPARRRRPRICGHSTAVAGRSTK